MGIWITVSKLFNVPTVDIDPIDRYFYWIDDYTQQIKRSYLPDTKTALGKAQTLTHLEKAIPSARSAEITAISVDWIGKNIYFADAINGTIKVARNDGRYLKTIINQNADLVHSLVVNPVIG